MEADVIILGDPFLRKYVSSFDYSTNKITIGQNKDAAVQTYPDNSGKVLWFLFAVACLVAEVALFYMCVKNTQRKRILSWKKEQEQSMHTQARQPQPNQVQQQVAYQQVPQYGQGQAQYAPMQPQYTQPLAPQQQQTYTTPGQPHAQYEYQSPDIQSAHNSVDDVK